MIVDKGLGAMPIFSESALIVDGFVGWLSMIDDRRGSPCPEAQGVYVVHYSGPKLPIFHEASCGGWFKGKDPSVSRDALLANWVDAAEIVYIGKANQLRRRIRQFTDFGAGKRAPHWGGRLIWQLASARHLRIAWKETPDQIPSQVEKNLIAQFRTIYRKPPFANDPHRLGC